MKKYLLIALLGLVAGSYGQQTEKTELACDCPSCLEKAASGKEFTLSGLQGLEAQDAEGDHDHGSNESLEHDEDAGNEHASGAVPHDHDGDGKPDHESHDSEALEEEHADHAGCDHAAEEAELDAHAGHDHGSEAAAALELTEEMIQKVGIQIHKAEGGTISLATVFPAEIKLNRDQTAAVSPRYASIVRQVFAEIGDTVRKGDVLASLENRETMAVYTVSAPLDGVILSKDLAVGETANDDKVLFEVGDLSSVWADISIFPQYQHLLRKGMPVKFIAHDGHTASGTVKYISPIISHETRTFTARCVLEGADEDFTPGAFVRARINVETADVPVAVPREAIQSLEGESVVFTRSGDGFVTAPVRLGLADEHHVEIKSGLKPGDEYVAVGAFALKAEMVTSGMDPHAGHGH
ncbi:efflux RND transporter periplasmic adaptor subunit [Pontiella sulfatireligans]|uniref:Cobalt-zinc-cadmium resistance protein CzcB n=1 Tax=Pontiella sulfatireligans TaxID=2750658 RepID=A0A6C2UMP0_9BACT|nr:efflux RND transporter periplasmic adaptor subunit [Pontiella sulfatireligans]VGO21535.1 Cobalt-zinc-cadmium resistance protein CzcB [Pontiella sulfatireligans]